MGTIMSLNFIWFASHVDLPSAWGLGNAFQFFVNFPIPLMKLSVLGKICQTFPKLEQHKLDMARYVPIFFKLKKIRV